tara:strand:- start:462 stop:1190 length:729 start_codon:yes stop_codon:yes gene_type:complete
MEYGQQMKDSRENAITSFYQNPGYQLERRNRKTFILKVLSDGTIHFNETLQEPLIIDRLSDIYLESFLTWHQKIDGKPVRTNNGATPAINTINFSSTNVPEDTDIEGVEGDDDGLDPSGNTTVSTGADADLINTSAFVLNINEFNNQGNSSLNDNDTKLFNKIVIPHTIPTSGESGEYRKIHKSRKLNYICSTNPTTLSSLTGTISGLDGTKNLFVRTGSGLGSNPFVSDMFLAEFVIIARD